MNLKEEKKYNGWAEAFILLLIIAALFVGCKSKKTLAQQCAELYPVKDSIITNEIRVVDTLLLPDTYIEYLDTTICPPSEDSVMIFKPVIKTIPGRIIYKERVKYDTIIIRKSTAEVTFLNHNIDVLQKQNKELRTDLVKSETKKKTWFNLVLMLIGALGLGMLARAMIKR